MRLFSEKVSPTFTSSDLNILTVKEFQEVFFDVFEFEINGKKFVAEKISEYKESPVVSIPLVLEGKELTAPFVLQRGEFEILFNKNNSTFVRESEDTSEELVIEYTNRDEEVEELIFEKKEDILKEIAQARQSAERYVEKLKQQKIDEAAEYFNEKKKSIDAEIAESKKGLLNEFLSLVENVKSEFYDFNEYEREKFSAFVERTISELTEQLTESLDKKQNKAEEKFSEQINELATNILANVLLKEIEANNNKSSRRIDEGLELISSSVKKIVKDSNYDLTRDVNNKLNSFNDSILNLEKINIELNDLINKGDNRALSRIGNIKTQLEESINSTSTTLSERIDNTQQEIKSLHSSSSLLEESILNNTTSLISRIDEAESRITTFYNDKISLIEEKVNDLSEDNKQYFLNLINESKISLLNEIANIKVDVPNIVIEKSNGKQEVDLKGIKSELEKIIGTRFSNELQSLKRLIEMSSGGGSVAKQFAAGGTMEGTLNVTGQYLSAGVDLLTLFSSGGGGGDENVNTLVRSNSAYWDEAYNTSVVYQSNSGLYATVDYTNSTFFPLTGGTVTGDTRFNSNVTIFGNLTTTGTTTFANTVFSVTSALSVVHIGTGPAVWVGNNGSGDIASFYDIDQNIEVLHVGGINSANPNVGIKTSTPNKTFTVVGEISSTSDITTSGSIGIGTSTPDERLTVSGNISASGIIYSNGQQVATLVSPERTTITGNGLLSTFPINGADNISNPSALIVAIDGVLQEPQIDYTVTSGEITFTSPVPDGSKGVIISPSNTVQIANITPSDGSVTSEKLASDIEISGILTAPNQIKNLSDVVINQRLFALMQSNIYNFNPQMFQFATALNGAAASANGHSLNLRGNTTAAFGGLAMAVLPNHNNETGHASIFEVDDTVANALRGGANPAYSQLDFRKRIIFQFEITTNFKHVSNNHNFFARLGGGSNAVNTSIDDALPDSTLPIGDCYVALLIEQGDIKLVTNQYLEYPIVLPNRIISQSFGSLGNFTNRCVKFSIEVYQGVASLYKSGVLIGSLSGCPTHTSHFSRGIAFGCNSLNVTTVVGSGYAVGNIKLIVLNN